MRLHALLSLLFVVASAASAGAQTVFPEIEPNSVKAEATIVVGILPGDMLTGVSTGSTTGVALSTLASADYWDIRPPILPPTLYCYSLDVTTIPAVDVEIKGESQTGGTINTGTDVPTQPDPVLGTPPPSGVWYGFGRAERLYVEVKGSGATTARYALTYTCAPVVPATTGGFKDGPITITTIAQGHLTNTEIQLYDAALQPVAGGHNDDYLPGLTTQSRVDVTLTAGIYYVAVSDYNMSTNLADSAVTEGNQNGNVLDFPYLIVNGSTNGSVGSPLDLSFAISDGVTTIPVTASKTAPYRIFWATFTVRTPSTAFCSGDGTGTACPCGNFGSPGAGCANSAFAGGGDLSNTGLASLSADSLAFVANSITGAALFIQGTGVFAGGNGIVFGDGLLCAGGTITRLGVVTPVGSTAVYTGPVSTAGGVVAPGTYRYQAWYRNAAAFCTASTFNLTNGSIVTWIP